MKHVDVWYEIHSRNKPGEDIWTVEFGDGRDIRSLGGARIRFRGMPTGKEYRLVRYSETCEVMKP
jgi:hypothetical protein